jgi:hypothetical protein
MTSELPATALLAAATAPDAVLQALLTQIGADGLSAAKRIPAVMAAVDQHAAAVRDSLTAKSLTLTAVPLASYGSSVVAAAARMGQQPKDPAGIDWSRADWFQLRLTAVCALAIAHDCI